MSEMTLGTLWTIIGGKTDPLARAQSETNRLLGEIDSRLDRTADRAANLFTGVVAGGTIVKFSESLIDAQVALQRIEQTLDAVTGSAAAGAKEYDFVRAESDRLGLSLRETAREFASFEAAAKGTGIGAEALHHTFSAVAEVGAKLHLSADQMTGSLVALQQMLSKGTVQSDELRKQLGNNLPGAFNIAARAIGVTQTQLEDMMKRGDVVASQFLPKFATELEKTFGVDASTRFETLQAKMNRFSTALFQAEQQFGTGTGFIDAFSSGLDILTKNMDNLVAAAQAVTYATASIIAARSLGAVRDYSAGIKEAALADVEKAKADLAAAGAARARLIADLEAQKVMVSGVQSQADKLARMEAELRLNQQATPAAIKRAEAENVGIIKAREKAAADVDARQKALEKAQAEVASRKALEDGARAASLSATSNKALAASFTEAERASRNADKARATLAARTQELLAAEEKAAAFNNKKIQGPANDPTQAIKAEEQLQAARNNRLANDIKLRDATDALAKSQARVAEIEATLTATSSKAEQADLRRAQAQQAAQEKLVHKYSQEENRLAQIEREAILNTEATQAAIRKADAEAMSILRDREASAEKVEKAQKLVREAQATVTATEAIERKTLAEFQAADSSGAMEVGLRKVEAAARATAKAEEALLARTAELAAAQRAASELAAKPFVAPSNTPKEALKTEAQLQELERQRLETEIRLRDSNWNLVETQNKVSEAGEKIITTGGRLTAAMAASTLGARAATFAMKGLTEVYALIGGPLGLGLIVGGVINALSDKMNRQAEEALALQNQLDATFNAMMRNLNMSANKESTATSQDVDRYRVDLKKQIEAAEKDLAKLEQLKNEQESISLGSGGMPQEVHDSLNAVLIDGATSALTGLKNAFAAIGLGDRVPDALQKSGSGFQTLNEKIAEAQKNVKALHDQFAQLSKVAVAPSADAAIAAQAKEWDPEALKKFNEAMERQVRDQQMLNDGRGREVEQLRAKEKLLDDLQRAGEKDKVSQDVINKAYDLAKDKVAELAGKHYDLVEAAKAAKQEMKEEERDWKEALRLIVEAEKETQNRIKAIKDASAGPVEKRDKTLADIAVIPHGREDFTEADRARAVAKAQKEYGEATGAVNLQLDLQVRALEMTAAGQTRDIALMQQRAQIEDRLGRELLPAEIRVLKEKQDALNKANDAVALKQVSDQLKLQADVLRLTLAGREKEIPLLQQEAALRQQMGRELLPAETAQLKAQFDEIERLTRQTETYRKLTEGAASAITDAMEGVILGTDSAADAMGNLISAIEKLALEALVLDPLKSKLADIAGQIYGIQSSGGGGGAGGGLLSAAISAGMAYFSGGSAPAVDLAGIAPRLAPAVTAGSDTTVIIEDHRTSGAAVETRRERGPDGRSILRAIIRDEVNSGFDDGAFDRTLRRNHNVTRRGNPR